MNKLSGLIAAPFTPLDIKGELALNEIDDLVNLYQSNGIKGAFICGTTGEGVSLTLDEKKQVIKTWGEKKGSQLKVLAMLGGTCLKEMQELALFARDHYMDGISIMSPFFFKPDNVLELVHFCKAVAETTPELPFYFYHIPAFSGGNFSMLRFLEIADEQISNLAGIKFTSSDLLDFHQCTLYKNRKYNLLWGTDEALLSGLVIGAQGAVGSTYNYAAPLYNEIIKSFQMNDLDRAEKLQRSAVKMVGLLKKYGGVGAGKAFMKIIGVDCGWFRPPVRSLSDHKVNELKKELEEIGFFNFCSKSSPVLNSSVESNLKY